MNIFVYIIQAVTSREQPKILTEDKSVCTILHPLLVQSAFGEQYHLQRSNSGILSQTREQVSFSHQSSS